MVYFKQEYLQYDCRGSTEPQQNQQETRLPTWFYSGSGAGSGNAEQNFQFLPLTCSLLPPVATDRETPVLR